MRDFAIIVIGLPENEEIHILASRVRVFPSKGRHYVVSRRVGHLGRLIQSVSSLMQYANHMYSTEGATARTFLHLALPLRGPIRNRNSRTGFAISLSLHINLTGGKHG